MKWYRENRNKYNQSLQDIVDKFPQKYQIGVVLVMSDTKQPRQKRIRRLMVVQNDKVLDIITQEQLKASDKYIDNVGLRFIQMTGKQYEIVRTVRYRRVDVEKGIDNKPFKDIQQPAKKSTPTKKKTTQTKKKTTQSKKK